MWSIGSDTLCNREIPTTTSTVTISRVTLFASSTVHASETDASYVISEPLSLFSFVRLSTGSSCCDNVKYLAATSTLVDRCSGMAVPLGGKKDGLRVREKALFPIDSSVSFENGDRPLLRSFATLFVSVPMSAGHFASTSLRLPWLCEGLVRWHAKD